MDDFAFDTPNLAAYERMLLQMGTTGARQAGAKAMRVAGNVVRIGITNKAPRKSGLLKRSIVLRSQGVQGDNIVFSVDVKKIAFYARFLEFGTSKMSPKPFFRPGVASSTQLYVATLSLELGKNIQAAWGIQR